MSNKNSNYGSSGSNNNKSNRNSVNYNPQTSTEKLPNVMNTSGSPFVRSSSTNTISPFLISSSSINNLTKSSPPSSPMSMHRFSNINNNNNNSNSNIVKTPTPLENTNIKEKIQQLGWMGSPTTIGNNGRMRSNSHAIGSPGSVTFYQYQLEEVSKKLEEKEKDAQLAAEIGKMLLDRNQELEDQLNQLLENESKYLNDLSEFEFLKNQNEILNENLKEATNENEELNEKLKQEEEIQNEKNKRLFASQQQLNKLSPRRNMADIDKIALELEQSTIVSMSKDKIITKLKTEKSELEEKLLISSNHESITQEYIGEISTLKEKNKQLSSKYKQLKNLTQFNIRKSIYDDFNNLKNTFQSTFELNESTSSTSFENDQNLKSNTKDLLNSLIEESTSNSLLNLLISKIKCIGNGKNTTNITNTTGTTTIGSIQLSTSSSNQIKNSNGSDQLGDSPNSISLSSSTLSLSPSTPGISDSIITFESSPDNLQRSSLLMLVSIYLLNIINEQIETISKEKISNSELLEDISELNEKYQNLNKINSKLEEKLEESNRNNSNNSNQNSTKLIELSNKFQQYKKQYNNNTLSLSIVIQNLNQKRESNSKELLSLKEKNISLVNQMEDIVNIKDNDISYIKEQYSILEDKVMIETKNSISLKEINDKLINDHLNNTSKLTSQISLLSITQNQLNDQISKYKQKESCLLELVDTSENEIKRLQLELNNLFESTQVEQKEQKEQSDEIINELISKLDINSNKDIEITNNLIELENSKNQLIDQINLLSNEKTTVQHLLSEKLINEQLILYENQQLKLKLQQLEDQLNSKVKDKEIKVVEVVEQVKVVEEVKEIVKQEEVVTTIEPQHNCIELLNDQDLSILKYINLLLGKQLSVGCKECMLKLFSDGLLFCELINKFIPESIDVRGLYKECKSKSERLDNINISLNSIKVLTCGQQSIQTTKQQQQNNQSIYSCNGIIENYNELINFIIEILYIGNVHQVNLTHYPELIYLWKNNPEISISQSKREESWDSFIALEETCLLKRWVNHLLKKDGLELLNNFSVDFTNDKRSIEILNCLLSKISGGSNFNGSDSEMESILNFISNQLLFDQCIIYKDDFINGDYKKIIILFSQLLKLNSLIVLSKDESMEIQAKHHSPDLTPSSEERACKGWLKTMDISTSSLDDFSDGLLLLKALDKVQPGIVNWKSVNMNPSNTFSMTENCNYCVQLGKQLKFSLVGIAGRDFVDGIKKFLLSFVWQMMRLSVLKRANHIRSNSSGSGNNGGNGNNGGSSGGHHGSLSSISSNGGSSSDLITESDLILKINKIVQKSSISKQQSTCSHMKSFSDPSLKDSVFLLDLLDSIQPGCINYQEIQKVDNFESYKSNAQYVITIARRLGSTAIIFWEDIVEVKQNMIMTFVCSLLELID